MIGSALLIFNHAHVVGIEGCENDERKVDCDKSVEGKRTVLVLLFAMRELINLRYHEMKY